MGHFSVFPLDVKEGAVGVDRDGNVHITYGGKLYVSGNVIVLMDRNDNMGIVDLLEPDLLWAPKLVVSGVTDAFVVPADLVNATVVAKL